MEELRAAALALYYKGRWELPPVLGVPQATQAEMWERLRDALGLEPGTTKHG